ncbi:alpha/beta hydrolase [Thermopetrobacter sp. TC1]|uniref:alpha/beta hydrolase n=1 Tax=Thermopetrobacter sp. TC1 TaxID=1495045 RepID=UPI00068AC343|nr:alpha/beta fold hydrolase [Thermopetrobacter sp. TC1]
MITSALSHAIRRLAALVSVILMLGLLPLQAQAKEVRIPFGQLVLNGNLELAEGKSLADGVLLMVHGTLAHNRMELIATLQELLKERGINTLAINLSLGISNRHNMYDCNQPMRHRHEDAVAEIAAWVDWLKTQGAKTIWLFGHSRGGNQVAWYAATRADPAVKKVVLLAPMTFDADRAAKTYQTRFGTPLGPMLDQAADFARKGHGNEPMDLPGILYCKNARATPESFLSYHAPRPELDTPFWLKRITLPTLVIAGSEDTVVEGLIEKVKPLADGKRITLRVIEDADHFFRDFAAEDAADAIAAFLKGA